MTKWLYIIGYILTCYDGCSSLRQKIAFVCVFYVNCCCYHGSNDDPNAHAHSPSLVRGKLLCLGPNHIPQTKSQNMTYIIVNFVLTLYMCVLSIAMVVCKPVRSYHWFIIVNEMTACLTIWGMGMWQLYWCTCMNMDTILQYVHVVEGYVMRGRGWTPPYTVQFPCGLCRTCDM